MNGLKGLFIPVFCVSGVRGRWCFVRREEVTWGKRGANCSRSRSAALYRARGNGITSAVPWRVSGAAGRRFGAVLGSRMVPSAFRPTFERRWA